MNSPAVEAPLDDLSYLLPDSGVPPTGLFVVDTSDLFGALSGSAHGQRKSLEKTCRMLGIETKFLHNAGNDAYVSGRPLPISCQRADWALVYPGSNDTNGTR